MSLTRKIKALMMKPLMLAGLIAMTAIPAGDAHAQTSSNGFCKYEQTTETITTPRPRLDINGNPMYITFESGMPSNPITRYPMMDTPGTVDIEKLKITIDHSKIQLTGGIINVSSAESCPLPGRSYAGLGADGRLGVISNDYLFSGVICVVQAIISESMLKVYCSILYWAKSAIDSAMVIYIMLYGLAIMFDLGNNPVRNAMKNFLKVMIIYLLATNATMAYNWLYKSFVIVITGFTEILTRDMIYDDTGQLVLDSDGKLFLKDGRKYNPAPTEGTEEDKKYVSNPFNIRIPKQQYYFVPDSANPATGEFKPVFVTEGQCDYLKRKYNDMATRYPDSADRKWPDNGQMISDSDIDMGYLGSCDVLIVKLAEPDYKPVRYFKDGTVSGSGCNTRTDINKCARPFNGIIGKFDSMFKNIVGDKGAKGLMGLAGALAAVTAGGGMMLSVILVSGIMAMFFAFFNMIFTFVSSLMGVTFMFMLAPVFIPFALFTPTFDYFKRWLSTVISFAMQPILVLAFLMVLGQVSSINRLAEVNKTVADGKVSKEIGGINIEAIMPLFQSPEFRVPVGERSHPHFRKTANPTEDDVGLVVSLESLKAWREAKLNYVKLRYILEKWGHGTIAPFTVFPLAPQVTVEDKNNTSVYIPPLTMVDFWEADGARIKKPNSTDANDVIETNKLVGTRFVPYRLLMQKKLQDNTDDDKFMTEISESGGLAKVLANPLYAEFKTLYEKEIGHKIYCESGCPDNTDKDPVEPQPTVNLCIRNCPEDAQGKQIDIFTTDQAKIDSCAKNCLYLQGGAEKFMKERNADVLLFIILTIATASFISLIPGLCKKLSHWSPGAGAAQGQMSAAALFGGSKRHLATSEYSNKEAGEMFHPGSLLDTGLDGGRQGALIATADKVLSTISGGAMKNPIGTLLEGGIKGLESQMQSNTANYVESKMNQAFASGTFSGVSDEVGKKMVEIAQKQGESGQMVYKELLQKEMANGVYTDRDRVSLDVQQGLQEMAEKAIEKEKAAKAQQNKGE